MKRLAWVVLAGLVATAACNQDKRLLWEKAQPGGEGGMEVVMTGGGSEPPPLGGAPPFPVMACEPNGLPCECVPEGECVCVPEPQPTGQCVMGCSESFCNMVCSQGSSCEIDCATGCQIVCEPFTSCDITCEGGCDVVCGEGSICTLFSFGQPSQIYCDANAVCDCPIPMNCLCFGPGCAPLPPPMP